MTVDWCVWLYNEVCIAFATVKSFMFMVKTY